MRICFFVANLGDGGAQRQCVALLNQLQYQPDIDVHLMLLGPGQHERDLDTTRLTVHRTELPNFSHPQALSFAIRTLRAVRPDALMSWLHPADIWSYPATRVVRATRWILAERSSAYPDELVYNVRKRLGRLGADLVIANSVPGQQLWAGLSPRTPVRVIPNMILSPPRQHVADPAHATDCLYVGRFMPQKNVTAVAAAFGLFATERPQPRLLMAGQGPQQDEVSRIAAAAGCTDRVDLLGFREDVPALMQRSRILLSLSVYEGMPNVVMEAVDAGLPVVVSDIPEHRVLLGPRYPYYVALDASADVAAGVIARAWDEGPAQLRRNYAHAQAVLANSAPARVVADYLAAFRSVLPNNELREDVVAKAAENGR